MDHFWLPSSVFCMESLTHLDITMNSFLGLTSLDFSLFVASKCQQLTSCLCLFMKYNFPFYFISLEQQSHRQLLHSQNLLPWHTSISPITISKYAMLYLWHSRPCLCQLLGQQIHWLCTRDLHEGPTVLTLLPLYLLGRATQLWGLWRKRPSLCLSYCTTFIFLVLLIFLLRRRMLRQKTVVVDKGKAS